MGDVSVDVHEFRALAAAVKGADADLRRRLSAGVVAAMQPVKAELAASARRVLPKEGGLNEWVASATVTERASYSGAAPGVTVTMSKTTKSGGRADLLEIDRGRVRHKNGHEQAVQPGFFSDVMTGPVTDRARIEIVGALEAFAADVARRTSRIA